MPQQSSNGSIWVPVASTLICALIVGIVVCLFLLVKEEMKKNDGCISSDQVLPATQSVVQKLVETKNHSSQESSCSSLESEVSAASPEVMHLQESQNMDA
jgi:flagellar basal body-associated protein FliL